MIYFLLIILFTLATMDVFLWRSFVKPSMILVLSFLFSSILIYINYRQWDVMLSTKFVFYVLSAIFSFLFAGFLVRIFCRKKDKSYEGVLKELDLSTHPSLFIFFITIICAVIYIILSLKDIQISFNLGNVLSQIYYKNVQHNGSNSFFANQMMEIITGIAYISFFQILSARYIVKDRNRQTLNYINILTFLFICIVSTDRNIFLRFIIYAFVLWILFYTKSNQASIKSLNWKIVRKSIFLIAIVIVLFYYFGKLKNYTSDFQRVLGIYGGSGLYNFNLFINKFIPTNLKYGASTLRTLSDTLGTIGIINTPGGTTSIFSEFIAFQSSTGFVYISNIYSALRPFVEDFGYCGMLIYPFCLGLLFEWLYEIVRRKAYSFFWIFYSYSIYPLVYFAIEEQFFRRLHLGTIYEISWIAIFYIILVQRKIRFKI